MPTGLGWAGFGSEIMPGIASGKRKLCTHPPKHTQQSKLKANCSCFSCSDCRFRCCCCNFPLSTFLSFFLLLSSGCRKGHSECFPDAALSATFDDYLSNLSLPKAVVAAAAGQADVSELQMALAVCVMHMQHPHRHKLLWPHKGNAHMLPLMTTCRKCWVSYVFPITILLQFPKNLIELEGRWK